ncbi:hypothetical protein K439DRAFT_1659022 [Ramaria rubella]|nr:hypothetical protein K439DRAFT_1659022 [Ramaria rubella]
MPISLPHVSVSHFAHSIVLKDFESLYSFFAPIHTSSLLSSVLPPLMYFRFRRLEHGPFPSGSRKRLESGGDAIDSFLLAIHARKTERALSSSPLRPYQPLHDSHHVTALLFSFRVSSVTYISTLLTRRINSRFRLATKATTFGNWTTAVRLRNGASVPPDIEQDLSTLLAFKLPRSLMELREVEGFASNRINPFLRSILQWGLNNVAGFQDEDTEQIVGILTHLCFAHFKITKSTMEGSKAFSQQQGIDDLLDCAFLPGSETPLNVIFEAGLRLSRTAMFDQESRTFMEPVIDPMTLVHPNAIADAIVTIQRQRFANALTDAVDHYQPVFDVVQESQWTSNVTVTPKVTSIITFAVEYKSRSEISAQHQLMMDLTTAQCQRKAVGLPDATLYGVTVCQSQLRIYASWWVSGRISFGQPRTGGTLDLNKPIDVLRCFFFFRMLRRRFVGRMTDEFATRDPSAAVQSLETFRWRMEDRPRTPSMRSRTDNDSESYEPRGSAQQDNMDEVLNLCENENGIELITQQEFKAWLETTELLT